MNCTKLSISLTKPIKQFAKRQAHLRARARGECRPNISSYVGELIIRDRREAELQSPKPLTP